MGLFSRLATLAAARFSRSRVLQPIEVVSPPALYLQHTRIGGRLTPQDVSAILGDADVGRMYRIVDLGNESRQKDGHLQSVLGTRELSVAQMRYHVTPASKSRQDKKIAAWCSDWLANFGADADPGDPEKARDMPYLLAHMQGAVYFGYAASETLFGRDGRYVIPTGAVPLHPRRFAFDLERGLLHFWDEFGPVPAPGINLMADYPGRFIQHQPRINGDTEAREGLIRVLIWLALFRNWALADWLTLAEYAWKPYRIGYYSRQATSTATSSAGKEDREALKVALQYLTTTGLCVLPDTVKLDVKFAEGKGDSGHERLCDMLAREMSKATLGQTLTVDQGSKGGGSYALGQVQNEVRKDLRDADAMACAATIRRQLIAPAVRLNFGAVAIPGFELRADDPVDLPSFSTGVKNLVDAGLDIPQVWARDHAGIPHPKVGEELVGGRVYGEDPVDEAKPVDEAA